MKQKVLIDVSITCDPPYTVGRWCRNLEDKAKQLESWCSDFQDFIRDHRSQDPLNLSVNREYQYQCSHCNSEWEEDEHGPLCCDKAQKEWDAEHQHLGVKEN